MRSYWIFYAAAAIAALAALVFAGRLKVIITSRQDAQGEYAAVFHICGIRILSASVFLGLEEGIRPRLKIILLKKEYNIYLLERRGTPKIKSLRIDALRLLAHIGVGDAAADALVCGLVNMMGQMFARTSGRDDWYIRARPVFGKTAFWLEAHCIISMRLADIIIALLGKKQKNRRKG